MDQHVDLNDILGMAWKPSQDLKADSPNLPEITTHLFCFVVLCCVCTGWFLSLHDGCCIKAMWRGLSVWYAMLPKLTKYLLQMSYSTQRSVWSSRLQSYCTHNAIFNNVLMFCFVFLLFFFPRKWKVKIRGSTVTWILCTSLTWGILLLWDFSFGNFFSFVCITFLFNSPWYNNMFYLYGKNK